MKSSLYYTGVNKNVAHKVFAGTLSDSEKERMEQFVNSATKGIPAGKPFSKYVRAKQDEWGYSSLYNEISQQVANGVRPRAMFPLGHSQWNMGSLSVHANPACLDIPNSFEIVATIAIATYALSLHCLRMTIGEDKACMAKADELYHQQFSADVTEETLAAVSAAFPKPSN